MKSVLKTYVKKDLIIFLLGAVVLLTGCAAKNDKKLSEKIRDNIPKDDVLETAKYYQDVVLVAMNELREIADKLETMVAKDFWPMPTYTDLLYNV